MSWWPCSCCIGCFYRCFLGRKKSKQNSIEPEAPLKSPTPSIALSAVSSTKLDELSIQEHLSLFYYGQTKTGTASGRRYSHPNQIKWVEEYESQRRASTCSTSPIPPQSNSNLSVEKPSSPPPSPVMEFPVIPPGRLL